MKRTNTKISQHYRAALIAHLKSGRQTSPEPARRVGREALAVGMHPTELSHLHEQILVMEILPGYPAGKRAALIKRAGIFFTLAVSPKGPADNARGVSARIDRIIETLSRRTVALAASNLELSREIAQRKTAENALKQSERHYSKLLEQSNRLQEQLRRLSRQILSAQEEERKRISRELHDVIAQTLTGINVRLAALKKDAAVNTKGLDRNIASTQRLVEHSVNIVHQFARELRPAVLDDLGLIPALHSFMKQFTAQSGVRTRLTAFAEVEKLDTARRTVLFRVAQEALNNVARHARANRVDVTIRAETEGICMTIKDDGKSFNVKRVWHGNGSKRLGLLGMRERLEMVGGCFDVASAAGDGTTVTARIPLGKTAGTVR